MLEIHYDDTRLEIDPDHGGRAVAWWIGEHQLLGRNSAHAIDHGMYPMAPWAGRIRGNEVRLPGASHRFTENFAPWAIHGLVLDEPFDVIDHQANRLVLERQFGAAWPFDGGVRSSWALGDSGLETTLEIYSSAGEFPAVAGWHPWFLRSVSDSIGEWSTDCSEILVRGADALPTGTRAGFDAARGPFDDALTGGTRIRVQWPGALILDIENSHPWYVVYDATDDFICIEPQTGPPDGLSGDHAPVTIVSPDRPLAMRTTWSVTRAQQAD
jgi:aldose 1-epimerase